MSEVRVPFPDPLSPDDLVVEVVDAARRSPDLSEEERDLTEALVFRAMERGTTTAAELAEELHGPDARRIVDEARKSIGLDTIADEEAHQRFDAANRALPPGRDAEGKIFQGCAAKNCNAYPQDELGVPTPVADRVWWCDRHKDQAGPEDHLPPEARYVLDPATMSPRAVGAERERLLEEDRERERKAAEREQLRREEAERLGNLEREWQRQNPPLLFGGPPPQ
jgi:hypothetical protein